MRQIKNARMSRTEYKLSWEITQAVVKILARSGDIDQAACLIRERLHLHTCYINYDMDAELDSANVAGLSTCFGEWFSRITKTLKCIPFIFTRDAISAYPPSLRQPVLNTVAFIRNLTKPRIVKPEHYRPLVMSDNLTSCIIDRKTCDSFLRTRLGELIIIPLQQNRGAMILIKAYGESFSQFEKKLLVNLANTISLNLDRAYYIYHDELGLNNSIFLKNQLAELQRCEEDFAVIGIKVNGLERINDDYSYAQGNMLLIEINRRLQDILKENGYFFAERLVARRSGFIFMVLLPGVRQRETLALWLEKLHERLALPYVILDKDNLELKHESTMGACLSVELPDGESIMEKVTDALQAARKNRQPYLIHCREIEKQKVMQQQVAHIIKQLKEDRYLFEHAGSNGTDTRQTSPFSLVYQPKVNVFDNTVAGWEALCRLNIAGLGDISPSYFIRMAEEENLIRHIDLWVAREACSQVMRWHKKGYRRPVSVNLSRYYMNQSDVIDDMTRLFSSLESDNYRNLLQFEITETGILNQQCLNTLCTLNRQLGIRFIIDDVGMKQANLYTLLTLYIHGLVEAVKIDKIYAAKILLHDEQGSLILDRNGRPCLDPQGCKYILSLLKSFDGLFTLPEIPRPLILCEGIEYQEQVDWLLENGCRFMQGFFFGQPRPAAECAISV